MGTGNDYLGSLLIDSGGSYTASSGTTWIGQNWNISGTYTHNSGRLIFVGSQDSRLEGSSSIYDLVINKTSTSYEVRPQSALTMVRDMTIVQGVWENNDFTHAIGRNFLKTGGTLSMNNNTALLDIAGNLTSTGGNIADSNSPDIYVVGDVNVTGSSFYLDNGALHMDGARNSTIYAGSGEYVGSYFYVAKSTGYKVTVLSDLNFQHFLHTNGIFDVNGKTVDAYGVYYGYSGAVLKMASGYLEVSHNGYNGGTYSPWHCNSGWSEQITGGIIRVFGGIHTTYGTVGIGSGCDFTPTGGTVIIEGTDDGEIHVDDASANFYDLIINRSGKTVSVLGQPMDVTNDITVLGGRLNTTVNVTVDMLNVTSSSTFQLSANTTHMNDLVLLGDLEAGLGTLTKNANSYWDTDFDSSTYSFSSTTISYGNNSGSNVIDARNAVDGGNNVPAGMWKFTGMTINLTNPASPWVVGSPVKLECAVSNDVALVNISLYHNESGAWKLNQTNVVSGTTASTLFNVSVSAERTWVWNCYACDSVACEFAAANSTVTVDLTDPSISYASPTPSDGRTLASTDSAVINITSSDDNTNHSVIFDWNNSLVGWWTFDNVSGTTVYDQTQNRENGSLTNGARSAQGYYGKSLYLDGNNDIFNVSYYNGATFPVTGTLIFWVKGDFLNQGDNDGEIFDSYQTTRNHIFIRPKTGTEQVQIVAQAPEGYVSSTIFSIQSNFWNHLVVEWDTDQDIFTTYLNGVLKSNSTISNSSWVPDGQYFTFSDGTGFEGFLDEIQLYDRVLSAAEINASYDASRYKYENTFSGLGEGATYSYTAHVIDQAGNMQQTAARTLTVNNIPSVSGVVLNATSSNNLTTDNLTVSFSQSDSDSGDTLANVTDWRLAGASIAIVNMPFDINISVDTSNAIADFSTNNNNGTLSSQIPLWLSNGKVGGAYNFSGTDYIDLGYNESMDTCSLTVAAWVYPTSTGPTSDTYRILSRDRSDYWMIGQDTDNGIEWTIYEGGMRQYVSSTGVLTTGAWNYVVGTYDGTTGVMRAFVNGKLVINQTPTTCSGVLGLGTNRSLAVASNVEATISGNLGFLGMIDEVLVLNRSLSRAQINASYQAGLAGHSVNTLVSDETSKGDNWTVAVTPADGLDYGSTSVSNSVSIASAQDYILTSCGTLNDADAKYILASDVNSSGTCFTIAANNITLDCKDYQINYSQSSAGYGITVNGYDYTNITNCDLTIGDLSQTNSYAISISGGASNTSITNVTIFTSGNTGSNTYNFGIYLNNAVYSLIKGNNITAEDGYNGRANVPIYVASGSNNIIRDNRISTNCYTCHGIRINDNNNFIINNTILTTWENSYGLWFYGSDGNQVQNNTITTTKDDAGGDSSYGIYLDNANSNILRGNTVVSYQAPSYMADDASTGNDVDQSNTAEGLPVLYNDSLSGYTYSDADWTATYGQVVCAGCTGMTYDNITMGKDGVLLAGSTNSVIKNSSIIGNASHGVLIFYGSGNNVTDSNISVLQNYIDPVKIRFSNNNIFRNNIINNSNNDYSIYLQNADYNTFVDNTITSTTASGILFYGSTDYENFTGNTITASSYAFNLDSQSTSESYFVRNSLAGSTYAVSGGRGSNHYLFTDNDYNADGFTFSSTSDHYMNLTNATNLDTSNFNSGTTARMFLHEYVDVNATDGQGNAVQSANVYAWNKDDTLDDSGITPASGIRRLTVNTRFFNESTSFNYNNFTINGSKGNINDSEMVNVTGYITVHLLLGSTEPTSPVIDLLPNEPRVADRLWCNITTESSDIDGDKVNYTFAWYKDSVWNRTIQYSPLNYSYLGAGNTSAGEVWNCTVTPYDGSLNGTSSSDKVTINRHPTIPVLSYPVANDSFFINRTPRFNWTNATDPDSDILTYELQVSLNADMTSPLINETNITRDYYQQPTEMDFATYHWRVRSYDGELWGNWTGIWNYTLAKYTSILLETDSVNFGLMSTGEEKNTSEGTPAPFRIENNGNWEVNISVNASPIWTSALAPMDTDYYQFKANGTDEGSTFDRPTSTTSWTNMTNSLQHVITRLNHSDGSDSVALDLRLLVPLDEDPGSKQSSLVFKLTEW
ncbi:MAG: hypothetical protein GXP63_02255 [DPANN group archaeon]|nr:hypothetical protein [DPANN group archaeon]